MEGRTIVVYNDSYVDCGMVVGAAELSDNGLQSADECSQPGPGRS